MSADTLPLTYASESKSRRRRYFHIFILPLLWLPAGIGSRIHYGDEYGSFVYANIPAFPVVLVLEHHVNLPTLFLVAIVFNFLLMLALGFLLDRLRTPRRIWLLFLILAPIVIGSGVWFPGSFPRQSPLPPGTQFHPEALFPGWAGALYVFVPIALLVAVFSRKPPKPPA